MSRIALGLMRINSLSILEIEQLIIDCLDHGITTFDIADIYGGEGKNESLLGEVFLHNPSLRKRMYLQSKIGIIRSPKHYDLSYDYIISSVKASLKRLHVDYLDCLLLHRPDIFMDNEEIALAVKYLLEHNLIKDFGVSNFSSSEIEYLKQTLPTSIKYNQVNLGLGNTTMIDQTMFTNIPANKISKENDDLFFFLKKEKITIQCWSPYQYGFFEGSIFDETKYPQINQALKKYADKYQTSKCAIATSFLLRLDPNLIVITGSTNIKHILESLEGEKINLSKADWYSLYSECGHLLP